MPLQYARSVITKALVAVLAVTLAMPAASYTGLSTARQALAEPVCSYTIGVGVATANGLGNYQGVKPGDTVCIASGTRGKLELKNFTGSASAPITFVNQGGQAVIASSDWIGIYVRSSRYLRLTGTGATGVQYGIKVARSSNVGVSLEEGTSNFEVDHLEVTETVGQGLSAKTEASCQYSRGTFTQSESRVHDNYVHDVGKEGFYLGSSSYDEAKTLSCGGVSQSLYGSVLKGVEVSRNRVERTGWDGIQVGSAVERCSVHDNEVSSDSQAFVQYQRSGLMINHGSVCDLYDNLIKDGTSYGIYVQGNGGNRIYNNVIVRSGRKVATGSTEGAGIYVSTGSNQSGSIQVLSNTIVQPLGPGVWYGNTRGSDNQVVGNLIVSAEGRCTYVSPEATVAASPNRCESDLGKVESIDALEKRVGG